MKVETSYQDKPVLFYWFSFGRWSCSIGGCVIRERIYRDGQWTPLVKVYKRNEVTV